MVKGHEVKKPWWPGKINDITGKYLEMYDIVQGKHKTEKNNSTCN